jgi:hypothetical protein
MYQQKQEAPMYQQQQQQPQGITNQNEFPLKKALQHRPFSNPPYNDGYGGYLQTEYNIKAAHVANKTMLNRLAALVDPAHQAQAIQILHQATQV